MRLTDVCTRVLTRNGTERQAVGGCYCASQLCMTETYNYTQSPGETL